MSPVSLSPGSRLGPYEILSRIGAGGMGQVFRARDDRLAREVAIKILPPELASDRERRNRFEQEARSASALNHPGIVTIHEIGETEGNTYLVMELVEGRTLRELSTEAVSFETLLRVGEQASRALAAAHAAGIVHRDIKPDNVMVRPDGYVKLLDFGLARLAPRETAQALSQAPTSLTQPGTLLGTLAYMSPEQASGKPAGPASDVFALGLVLYELAAGQHPFAAENQISVLHGILSGTPLPPSSFNPEIVPSLDALLLEMLEKDPERRPGAERVADALAELREGAGDVELATPVTSPLPTTVGRVNELAELTSALEGAVRGKSSLISVGGEPGIGKTTLVETFLARSARGKVSFAVGRGRCSERLAGTDAYLPFLEAFEGLLRSEVRELAARLMRRIAPSWYVQIIPSSLEAPAAGPTGATAGSAERLKRELVGFLEELSRSRSLVLFFDDVHWADASTVELLAHVAARFMSLHVLIIATYRPSELILSKHPFLQVKRDFQSRGSCRDLKLDFLSREELAEYLDLEFPGHRFPEEFASLIHSRTEGSPLFMVDLLRYLRDRGVIALRDGSWELAQSLPDMERDLPESVRGMIHRKIDQLDEWGRRLATAAAVQGNEFDTVVLAAALQIDPADVEERMEALDRVHFFVHRLGEEELPDRTLTLRYRFVHVLYQHALYGSLTPARRASLAASLGTALLSRYGEQCARVASELAFLFETARRFSEAAEHFLVAVREAARIFAYQEAVLLTRRGLAALGAIPDSPERARQELELQVTLGGLLIVTKGGGAAEVEGPYLRATELGGQLGESPLLFAALRGLSEHYHEAGRLETSLDVALQALATAERLGDSTLIVDAHHAVSMPLVYLGRLIEAQEHLERAIPLYTPDPGRRYGTLYQAIDPGVGCRYQSGRVFWLLGYPDQALGHVREAVALARKIAHPYSIAQAHEASALVHQFRGEPVETREHASAAITWDRENEAAEYLARARIYHGWAAARLGDLDGGIQEAREGLAALAHRALRPHLMSFLIEALMKRGDYDEAAVTLAEALSLTETGGRYFRPELLRLDGELQTRRSPGGAIAIEEAEVRFREALDLARRMSAKSLELRAAMSLVRLGSRAGRENEGAALLRDVYGSFTEGHDTADLKEARTVLDGLSQGF